MSRRIHCVRMDRDCALPCRSYIHSISWLHPDFHRHSKKNLALQSPRLLIECPATAAHCCEWWSDQVAAFLCRRMKGEMLPILVEKTRHSSVAAVCVAAQIVA